MKTLRKVSFESFDRLSITEAAQLYGGTGEIPPTSTVPTDSIGGNRNDSIPPTKTPIKQNVSVGVKYEPNKSTSISGTYDIQIGDWKLGGTAGYNTKTGPTGGITVSYTFGKKK